MPSKCVDNASIRIFGAEKSGALSIISVKISSMRERKNKKQTKTEAVCSPWIWFAFA